MSILPFLFWLHLLGVSIWVGGSLLMPIVIIPAVQSLEPPSRLKPMAAVSKRLTPWITASIILVFLTGIEQTRIVYGFEHLLGINVLTIKIFVALLMMVNGFYLGVVLVRKVGTLAPAPGAPPAPEFLRAQRLLGMHSWIQAGMAVIILLLVGFLTA